MKQITIIGNIGTDATYKKSKNGYLLNFNVAVNSKVKEEEKTDWFSCARIYKEKPETILQYLKKGQRVCIIGDISFNQSMNNGAIYFNKNVYASELKILFDRKEENGE